MSLHLLQDVITSDKISPCLSQGNSKSGQASVGVCIALEPGIASREGGHIYENVSGTLRSNMGDNQMSVAYCYDIGDRRRNPNEFTDVSPTLLSKMGTGGNNVPCVVMDRASYNQGENALYNIGIDENGVAFSHIAKGPGAVCYIDTSHADDVVRTDNVVSPLQARDYKGGKLIAIGINGDVAGTLDSSYYKGCGMRSGIEREVIVECKDKPKYIVRRLTPLECERLQGFPDYYTDIGEYTDSKGKKKKSSDSARYKALGNSIALPPWKWVIKRLCSHYERDATMASLFDGIGGFPLIWEQTNGKGSCLWASEIEDFPIAVTKMRIE